MSRKEETVAKIDTISPCSQPGCFSQGRLSGVPSNILTLILGTVLISRTVCFPAWNF